MSFTFLYISILTWRGRWKTHPTSTLPPHPCHPLIPRNTSQYRLFCHQLEHGDGDGAYTSQPYHPPPPKPHTLHTSHHYTPLLPPPRYPRTCHNTGYFTCQSLGTWRGSMDTHPYHPPPPKPHTLHKLHHSTPPLPPHIFKNTSQYRLFCHQLEHGDGDGDGAYTPTPTTHHHPNPYHTTTYRKGEFHPIFSTCHILTRRGNTLQYKLFCHQLEHGDGDGAYTPIPTTHHHPNS